MQQSGRRVPAAADAVAPDDDAGAEREQDRDAGQHQGAGQRGQRRNDVERARAHDDDGDEGGGERKQGDAPRPDGKPRNRLIVEDAAAHDGSG